MSLNRKNRILVFDTETTGLTLHPEAPLAKQPKIIEFGAVVLEAGIAVEEFKLLLNPEEPLTEEITSITGLKDEDLRGAQPFREHVEWFRLLFGSCAGVMAHNLPFDKAMIMNDLRRAGVPLKEFPWPERELCTVGLYKDAWGRNPKLLELYEDILGKPLAQTHRALDDVKALVEIIQEEELWALA